MEPAIVDLKLTENAYNVFTFTRSGVNDATGWSGTVHVRAGDMPGATLYGSLTSGAGITLASSSGSLNGTVMWTETQSDGIVGSIAAGGDSVAYWSLKLNPPSGTTEILFKGQLQPVRTTTS